MVLFITGSLLAGSLWLFDDESGAAPNNDTMSAYLKLDELTAGTAADSSGDGNSGTVNGATASVDAVTTSFTNARSLSFDGDDYVEVADAPELSGPAMTVSAWVKFNALSGIQTIVAKWDVTHWQEYVLQTQDDDLYFYTGDGSNLTSDFISLPNSLTTGVWYHVAGTISGTARALHLTELNESTNSDSDTAATTMNGSDAPLSIGAKQNNGGAYFEYLNGLVDDVRVYNRELGSGEVSALASGIHTNASWDGSDSSDYDTAANWSTGAVPDPYTSIIVPTSAASQPQPIAGSDIAVSGMLIQSGGRLNLNGWDLTINDGGTFNNAGTLQLKNSETLTGFSNDTDSGTILLTPDGDVTGLKTGNTYNNLIINDSTLAHWPLDEAADPEPDMSGFGNGASYQGAPSNSADVPAVSFANDNSVSLDGTDDYLAVDEFSMPSNATWCGWVKMDAGDGVILGSSAAERYALRINGGTEVAVNNQAGDETAAWSGLSSLYGSWHHLCVTQTYSLPVYTLGFYLDGAAVGSTEELSGGVSDIDAIGRGGTSYFDGLVDDIRIYNRTLNPTEIDRLYDGFETSTYTSTQTLAANLDVNGNFSLATGRLDVSASDYDINIGGDLRNDGGVLLTQQGEVILDGGDQSINSSQEFYDLTKSVSSAATLTFGKDSTTTVTNQLTLSGASGQLLSLRSSTPGTQWHLDPTGNETISYLDVQDSDNIDTEPVDMTNANITDSGNNINWTVNVAPDDPTTLGPTGLTDGSFTTDTTPTLTFSLSDDNPVDDLRYQVQIDDNSDFSSPEVDYVSALADHGARSFTVGQNEADDQYLAGADDMLMVTGDYYWRVKAIDDYDTPNQSDWTAANSGSIAFKLDVTGPSTPGTPTTASGSANRRPTWDWTASSDPAGLASPIYTLQWSTDPGFGSYSASTSSSLSFTHGSNLADGQWYFRVRATDSLGNHSAWATSAAHLIDMTGPTTPVAPFTSSPTSITTPTWSWAASSDAGAGLHSTEPYIINWSLTSNFSGTVYNTTSSSNIFTHSTGLADGTWYIRVRAQDALNNLSSWSSNGQVLIDGSAPSLAGAPSTDDPTNDNTPTWTWDASIDEGAGLHSTQPYSVQWSQSPSFSPVAGSTTTTTNSYTHGTNLDDGTWYIRVSAKDALNNQSGYSSTGETTVDTVAPDVPVAPSTTTPTADNTPTWTWAVPDDNSGGVGLADSPYEVEWSTDEAFGTVEASDTGLSSPTFDQPDALADGTWYFRVRATDRAGNTSAYSTPGEVLVDITAPSVPGDPSTVDPVNDNTPTWTWAASGDTGSGLDDPAYELQWSTDNTFTTGVIDGTVNTNEFTHSSNLADGTWYFRVRAVDNVSNESAWSNAGNKIVDSSPPTTPGTPSTTTPTADNTPSWTWTASTDAGAGLDELPYLIEWSQDSDFVDGFVGTDTIADPEFTHTDDLADGTWYFRVRAVDDVGNLSVYSPTGSVFIDTAAPSTPGTPSTATPTTDGTPNWTWTASSDGSGSGLATNGYIVEWSDDNFSTIYDDDTATSASFTQPTDLPDGTWYFRVRAVDVVGNTSADSGTASVEIDNTAPSVPGAPTTDTPTNITTPTWGWAASTDNYIGLDNPAYELQWSTDNTFTAGIQNDTVNTNEFTHSIDLPDGTWYFRVRAVDELNNTSAWSATGSVIVSTDGPSVPGDPVPASAQTTDTTPDWVWSASTSDAGLASPAYHLEWSQDSGFGSGVSTETSATNSFTHSDTLTDGTWYFHVMAEDLTGMFSEYSSSGTVLVDTASPSVPGSPNTTSPSADTTPAWSWTASTDGGSGLAEQAYEVEWSQDSGFGSGVSTATSDSPNFTQPDPLTDGTWYFRVRAVDGVGNLSAFASSGSVVIDSTAPSVPGMPSPGSAETADTTPDWNWSGSTDDGVGLDDPAYEMQWSQSSSFASGVSTDSTNNTNFTHITDLADGTWYFRVRAVDGVGNQSAWSASGQVEVDSSVPETPGDPTTPTPTNDQTPTWTWEASDDNGVGLDNPAYQVEWSQASDFGSGVTSDTTSPASFTHGSNLPDGTWYLRVRAVDAVGNESGWSATGEVIIDTNAPDTPAGTPTTTTPTADNTPTWTWGPDTGDNYQVEWSQAADFGSGVSNDTSATEDYTHGTGLTDGTWYFRVRAVDEANNTSGWSAAGSVIVDVTAPSVPSDPTTTTPTNNQTPSWSWDPSDDGSGVGLDDYEVAWSDSEDFSSDVSTDTSASTSYEHSSPLGFGIWFFRVRSVDTLGNASAWSATGEVNIDNEPPVISSMTATPQPDGAIITWTTNELASSLVEYGAGSGLGSTTSETDTDPRVTIHSVTLSGLPACATYTYRVKSTDLLNNQATSVSASFTTTTCSGNSAVTTQETTAITTGSGGQASLNSGSAALLLGIPAGFADTDADFQIKQLSPASALEPIGLPSGHHLIGSHLYDLKAVTSDNVTITSFDEALNITITYAASEASGYDTDSLVIFRWDGSAWQKLSGCQVNKGNRSVKCTTSNFSVFGLFGVRSVATPAPALPEGDGTVDPEPEPPVKVPTASQPDGSTAQAEGTSDSRGLASTFTRFVRTVVKRPVWWVSLLLLIGSAIALLMIRKHRGGKDKHVPYGIHRDKE